MGATVLHDEAVFPVREAGHSDPYQEHECAGRSRDPHRHAARFAHNQRGGDRRAQGVRDAVHRKKR